MLMRLPHDVSYMMPVLQLLEKLIAVKSAEGQNKTVVEPEATFKATEDGKNKFFFRSIDNIRLPVTENCGWQSDYCLLLWLTVIVANPFDLQRFAGSSATPIVDRVYNVSRHYLRRADTTYLIAARLMAQLTGEKKSKSVPSPSVRETPFSTSGSICSSIPHRRRSCAHAPSA